MKREGIDAEWGLRLNWRDDGTPWFSSDLATEDDIIHHVEDAIQSCEERATMMFEWLEVWKASDLARRRSEEPPR